VRKSNVKPLSLAGTVCTRELLDCRPHEISRFLQEYRRQRLGTFGRRSRTFIGRAVAEARSLCTSAEYIGYLTKDVGFSEDGLLARLEMPRKIGLSTFFSTDCAIDQMVRVRTRSKRDYFDQRGC
jgi:hypothetical protein